MVCYHHQKTNKQVISQKRYKRESGKSLSDEVTVSRELIRRCHCGRTVRRPERCRSASQDTCLFCAIRSFHSKHRRRLTESTKTALLTCAYEAGFFYIIGNCISYYIKSLRMCIAAYNDDIACDRRSHAFMDF